jgi:hypothetical protein
LVIMVSAMQCWHSMAVTLVYNSSLNINITVTFYHVISVPGNTIRLPSRAYIIFGICVRLGLQNVAVRSIANSNQSKLGIPGNVGRSGQQQVYPLPELHTLNKVQVNYHQVLRNKTNTYLDLYLHLQS